MKTIKYVPEAHPCVRNILFSEVHYCIVICCVLSIIILQGIFDFLSKVLKVMITPVFQKGESFIDAQHSVIYYAIITAKKT